MVTITIFEPNFSENMQTFKEMFCKLSKKLIFVEERYIFYSNTKCYSYYLGIFNKDQ